MPVEITIPLIPGGPGGRSTWEPTLELGERETSFGGIESQRTRVLKNRVEGLCKKLSQKWARTSEVFHYDLFELIDGKLYFRDKIRPLTTRDGKLRLVKEIKKILGDRGLRDLDFNISKGVTAKQAAMLNLVEEEIPSASDVDKAGDIELQEIAKSTEDLIFKIKDVQTDTDDLFKHPLRELLGLDTQLRSIRGSLRVEVAKKGSVRRAHQERASKARGISRISQSL